MLNLGLILSSLETPDPVAMVGSAIEAGEDIDGPERGDIVELNGVVSQCEGGDQACEDDDRGGVAKVDSFSGRAGRVAQAR
jgi:hypothetical protein